MTITAAYEKYKTMPSLQMHMLRVAGVALVIAQEHELEAIDELVSACLLHDMGNIIKFKLDLYPEFLKPQGLEYWQGVKDKFIQKYGDEEHEATYAIATELNVSSRVMEIIKKIGFSKAEANTQSDDLICKIACYSDHRVSPDGVLSLEERIADGKKRFVANKGIQNEENKEYLEKFNRMAKYMKLLEEQIFKDISITPAYVDDVKVNQVIDTVLKDFDLQKS